MNNHTRENSKGMYLFKDKSEEEFLQIVEVFSKQIAKELTVLDFTKEQKEVLHLMILEREYELSEIKIRKERWESIRRQVIGWGIITFIISIGSLGYWLWGHVKP